MQTYKLIRGANVDVIKSFDKTSNPIAQIIVNDSYMHTFSAKSDISQQLKVVEAAELQERLTGGSYFFVGDSLVDFRNNNYTGFIHSDASIEKLIDVLGFRETSDTERKIMRLNTVSNSGIILNKRWVDDEFHIPGYLDGGDFTSRIGFTWNPFHTSVRGVFEIVRQICTNGMVGINDVINCKVPLVNRWEEHLNIAAIQLRNAVQNHTQDRLGEMGKERASVSDLQLIKGHASERLDYMVNIYDEQKREQLTNIIKIADPTRHLKDVYTDEVFNSTALGSRAQSHLTKFDAWNLVTEMFTHTLETGTSTGAALQRIANALVFPARDSTKGLFVNQKPIKSAFSDPEIAFFGNIIA